MEVRMAERIDGEVLEILDDSGRCIGEMRCNDLAYREQFRDLAFCVYPARGAHSAPPRASRLLLFPQQKAAK